MASQVLSGSGPVSYTNNTGQNVRVIINYCGAGGGSVTNAVLNMSWAGVSIFIGAVAFGRNLAFAGGGSGISAPTFANNFAPSAQSGSYPAAPTEIMLSNGQTFSLGVTSSNTTISAYNIVIIKEDGT